MDLGKAKQFIEEISRLYEQDALVERTSALVAEIGFDYFACVSHVDLEHLPADAVGISNYPEAWVHHYVRNHLEQTDPVQRYIRLTLLPFFWTDPAFLATLSADQTRLMEEARAHGIADGYTVPLRPPGHLLASFSVCPGSRTPKPESHLMVHLIAPYVFEQARRIGAPGLSPPLKDETRLTARQRQCLELAALGKSDWVIGEILNISERTVHHHLESAKKRLGVATRAQAIVEALRDAQISMADIQRDRS